MKLSEWLVLPEVKSNACVSVPCSELGKGALFPWRPCLRGGPTSALRTTTPGRGKGGCEGEMGVGNMEGRGQEELLEWLTSWLQVQQPQ